MTALADIPVDGQWRPEHYDGPTLLRRRRWCLVRYVAYDSEVQRQIACETPSRPFLFGTALAATRYVPELEWREKENSMAVPWPPNPPSGGSSMKPPPPSEEVVHHKLEAEPAQPIVKAEPPKGAIDLPLTTTEEAARVASRKALDKGQEAKVREMVPEDVAGTGDLVSRLTAAAERLRAAQADAARALEEISQAGDDAAKALADMERRLEAARKALK